MKTLVKQPNVIHYKRFGKTEIVNLNTEDKCGYAQEMFPDSVLRFCQIQPQIYDGPRGGVKQTFATCGPLCYINHYRKCPIARAVRVTEEGE